MSNAPLLMSLSSARSTTPSHLNSLLFTGSLYNSVSNSKFFFLCTKLSINSRHPTYLTYYSCNHNADSLDHPHLPISLSCPEPMLCHLQIAHSPVFDQKNGTLSPTTSRMLTLFTSSRNSSNVFYSNKCININFIQMS